MRDRLRKTLGVVLALITAWQAVTGFQSALVGGLLLNVAIPVVAVWGLWPWLQKLAANLPGGQVRLRSPFVPPPAKTKALAVSDTRRQTVRGWIKQWYFTHAQAAGNAAQTLTNHLATQAGTSEPDRTAIQLLIQVGINKNLREDQEAFESELSNPDADGLLLLSWWASRYRERLKYLTEVAARLKLNASECPAHAAWRAAHDAMVAAAKQMMARDEFDSSRQAVITVLERDTPPMRP